MTTYDESKILNLLNEIVEKDKVIAELESKLNISAEHDVVWVTREEVKQLQLCDEYATFVCQAKENLSKLWSIANSENFVTAETVYMQIDDLLSCATELTEVDGG